MHEMKFKLNKILSAFGNTPSLEPTHDDNYIKDIIKSIDEEAFAVSEQNVLFAKVSELGGYYYVITIVVGRFKIKTKNGGNLSIEGKNFNLILNSDMDEFEFNELFKSSSLSFLLLFLYRYSHIWIKQCNQIRQHSLMCSL